MEVLVSEIVRYSEDNLPKLPEIYLWPKSEKAARRIANSAPFSLSAEQSRLNMTVEMKKKLHDIWKKNSNSDECISTFIVNIWGGIRTTHSENLKDWAKTIRYGEIPDSLSVASWSKIAAIADPERHAVLDARVAFSLNALQALSSTRGPRVQFKMRQGRNMKIAEGHKALHSTMFAWENVTSGVDAYKFYIEALKRAAQRLGESQPISSIEMLLFADADRELYRRVSERFGRV